MITFLYVFNDGNEVQVQKSMTLAQSKIWAKEQLQKLSPHVLWIEIREKKNCNTLYVFKDIKYNIAEPMDVTTNLNR